MIKRDKDQILKELEFRMAVTTAMLSTLDLGYVLYVILSGITSRDGLGFNRAFLFLDDEEGRELRVNMAVGPHSGEDAERIWTEIEREEVNFPDLLPRFEAFQQDTSSQALTRALSSFTLPLSKVETLVVPDDELKTRTDAALAAALATCIANNAPFCSNRLTLSQEIGGAEGGVMQLQNVAIVPLTMENRLIGVIVADNFYSRQAVDGEGLRSLQAMGNLAALAIDRARLHAKAVSMAEVDGLTGVYNRRYYATELEKAIVAAVQSGHQLAIVVFDLDHFKRVNDQHGHVVGDGVLKDVAKLLVGGVRSSDMVARYGGEEFVLLLKNTPQEVGVQVAEKLRHRVKNASLVGGEVVGLTLSAGVATIRPNDTATSLFARADKALYAAKAAGRDRVVAAGDV